MHFLVLFLFSPDSNDVLCFCPSHYLASSGMFAYIGFGSSNGVFFRGLKNDLAHLSNLVARDICLYRCALSKRDERDEERDNLRRLERRLE